MPYLCIRNKEGKFAVLHEGREQKGILTSECGEIKRPLLKTFMQASDCKSRSIQKPNPSIRLQCLILEGDQSQLFRSS